MTLCFLSKWEKEQALSTTAAAHASMHWKEQVLCELVCMYVLCCACSVLMQWLFYELKKKISKNHPLFNGLGKCFYRIEHCTLKALSTDNTPITMISTAYCVYTHNTRIYSQMRLNDCSYSFLFLSWFRSLVRARCCCCCACMHSFFAVDFHPTHWDGVGAIRLL